MTLRAFHERMGARFTEVGGTVVVADYGDGASEYEALQSRVAVLDLSFRSRLCLLGRDRVPFLHGQVTNDVKGLTIGQGCYAALVNAKGRMQSDLNVYVLAEEILLDFEPGLTEAVRRRLEQYVVAEEVEVVEVGLHYGLLSFQGSAALQLVNALGWPGEVPASPLRITQTQDAGWGEVYLALHPRVDLPGYDLFVPQERLEVLVDRITGVLGAVEGRWAGWETLETARIEAGIPRFGADMDESNLVPETGIEARAISYRKGCYIGQEVIARIRTYGQVARALRGLRLPTELGQLPRRGARLFLGEGQVGVVTSAVRSPRWNANLAMGYVRREANADGTRLECELEGQRIPVEVVMLPFGEIRA